VSSRFRAFVVLSLLAGGAAFALVREREADAQRLDPRHPNAFVVGSPSGPAPMQRVDGRRSGETKHNLPGGSLSVAWRKAIGLSVDQPALAASDGTLAIVTGRGDVVFLDADGDEKAHVNVNGRSAGPAALTSDNTVVFSTSTGDAVGVRRASTQPRYITRIGGDRNPRSAPLALDDGGVVLATTSDLVVLDAEGNVRSRVTLPDAPAAPLLASGDKILSISSAGTVYGWTPGREPVRMGSFGAPIDGGAALADASTLLAVIEGNHLVELDLRSGTRSTRSIAGQGLYLGPPALRKIASGAVLATVIAMQPSRLLVVTLDPGGQDVTRAPIATLIPPTLGDGGPAPIVAPLHTGPLVDARGAVAFASTEGRVGMITPDGAVEPINETLCSKSSRSSGIAGLTPYGRGAFVVTCEGGSVAKIVGTADPSLHKPTAPAKPGARPPPDDDTNEP
jgi:hypothetical protein